MPPRATTAFAGARLISADAALELRDGAREHWQAEPEFRCYECRQVVYVHRTNRRNGVVAHFEHQVASDCSLSSG